MQLAHIERHMRAMVSVPRMAMAFVGCVVGMLGIGPLEIARSADRDTRPNVVFILADDLGWSDTTLYGHTRLYQTPNIERLARRGVTLTRAYSASPLCSPTRSAILTGLSPARTGITAPACHLPEVVLEASVAKTAAANKKATVPSTVTRLKTEYRTIAETLKDAGYATGHFGKWHLGAEPYSPLQHGFDVDVPHHPGPGPAGSYVAPWKFKDFDHDPGVPDQHIEDRMAEEAVAWIERHRDEPFFLNYWMFSVHAPFDAKRALIEKYREQVDLRDPQRSPTYAAMIESMDDAVGTLLDALDRFGLAEHTIVIFTSDNGGNMYNEVDGTTPTSNAPLRGGKATMFEGGTRVPGVVVWPGKVEAGSRSDALVQSEDFYPTLLDGLDLPLEPGQRFDGVSVLPALAGKPISREAVFQYFPHDPGVPDWLPPSVSVHQGDWKLIRIFHGGENGAHRYLLFNLADDLGETRNLAASEPARVRELDALIDGFLAQTGAVLPLPNPAFDPAKYRPEDEGQAKPRRTARSRARNATADSGDDPRLQGWKARGCKADVQEGIVTITSTSDAPFLGVSAGRLAAGAKVRFRLECGGGEGKVEWLPGGPANPTRRPKPVPYAVKAGGWAEIAVDIPVEPGESGVLRLYVPAGVEPARIDWIKIDSAGKTRAWEF